MRACEHQYLLSIILQPPPRLKLNSGPTAVYYSGSGTSTLDFMYIVAAGDSSTHLNYASTLALESGAALYDSTSSTLSPLVLQLPALVSATSLGGSAAIAVDTSAARILSVTSPLINGVYASGQSIPIVITFSVAVVVDIVAPAVLHLDIGALNNPGVCSYTSGSGSTVLTWTYTVREGDVTDDLATLSTVNNGAIGGIQGSIKRFATISTQVTHMTLNAHSYRCKKPFCVYSTMLMLDTAITHTVCIPNAVSCTLHIHKMLQTQQDANVTLPTEGLATSLSGSKDVRINTKPPAVVAIASRRHGVMTYGSIVDLQVIFDKPVQVNTTDGIPTIAFGLDDGTIKYVFLLLYYYPKLIIFHKQNLCTLQSIRL
jgi:hypothetical protein